MLLLHGLCSMRAALQRNAGSGRCMAPQVLFGTGLWELVGRRTLSRKRLLSSTMFLKASSSYQHSFVVRHSSCTTDVTTKFSSAGPRLRRGIQHHTQGRHYQAQPYIEADITGACMRNTAVRTSRLGNPNLSRKLRK